MKAAARPPPDTGTANEPATLAGSTHPLGWDMLIQSCGDGLPASGAIMSPLSVVIALGMLAGGAGDAKRRALSTRMGVADPQHLSTAFAELSTQLGTESEDANLTLANAVFYDQTVKFNSKYSAYLKTFQADEFEHPSLPDAVAEINSWIADQTRGLIKDMLSRSVLKNAHVVLVNALAFKGDWETQFDPAKTQKEFPFTLENGKTRPVQMMFRHKAKVHVAIERNYKSVLLQYKTVSKSATVIVAHLPNKGSTVQAILPEIRAQGKAFTGRFSPKELDVLGLPKFEIDYQTELSDMLKALGFQIQGNFPEMGAGRSEVDSVIHQARIQVDEEGTVAAAATAVIMKRGRPIRTEDNRIIFDRPFAFSIVAEKPELVLFTGVFNPE